MTIRHLILLVTLALAAPVASAQHAAVETVKKERNHIRSGNKLFHSKRYAEAEVEYRKALQEAPQSGIARFNLATALLMQGGGAAGQDDTNNPVKQAADILTDLAKNAPTADLRAKANYDLGNLAYGSQQYAQAVELYKQALRHDPEDNQARYNLRMAQLKLREQQQNQNQNQDQSQNKDKNQDQDQDKDKKDKDKDNENDSNQDQNKDNKNNRENRENKDNDRQNQNQDRQQGGMSQQNAEQVLKTMQNQENATQQRVNAVKAQEERRERSRTNRKW